jgi:hypothetical protein
MKLLAKNPGCLEGYHRLNYMYFPNVLMWPQVNTPTAMVAISSTTTSWKEENSRGVNRNRVMFYHFIDKEFDSLIWFKLVTMNSRQVVHCWT